jgi:hypothetical protein
MGQGTAGRLNVSCIWCKDPDPEPSVEEILLASLGGPPELVFRNGEVCRPCNNGLGHLDQIVADDFDIAAFHMGVPRRKGRPPVVQNRGNFRGFVGPDGPTFVSNMDKEPKTLNGVRVLPWRGGKRDIRTTLEIDGPIGTMEFETTIGEHPKFVRGMTKMAFELAAFYLGPHALMGEEYDAVRAFVRRGRGQRHLVMHANPNPNTRYHVEPPLTDGRGGYLVRFCIFGVDFGVDLTPGEDRLRRFALATKAKYGTQGWTILPIAGPLSRFILAA